MARQEANLISALEAEARAHQQLVNIGDELKTVYMAGQKPDDDEMLRLRQAYEALLGAARAVHAAAYDELNAGRAQASRGLNHSTAGTDIPAGAGRRGLSYRDLLACQRSTRG